MGLLDAPGVTPAKLRVADLLARLSSPTVPAIPPIATGNDIPTITTSASRTVTQQIVGVGTGQVTEVGTRGSWDGTFSGWLVAGLGSHAGLDLIHTGTTVEFGIASNTSANMDVWVWVNGAPLTATPSSITATGGAGTTYWYKLVFPTSARRRVELFANPVKSWFGVNAPYTDLIAPAPRKPVVAIVGDSFFAGTTSAPGFLAQSFMLARYLGVESATVAYGGTGYVAGSIANGGQFGAYGDTARMNLLASFNPELVIVQGSVNDDGQTGVQAAAGTFFQGLVTRCPKAKVVVFGPQPNNATSTIAAARVTNVQAVAAAAAAAPNVLGFHDEIGIATAPAAWSSATAYSTGALVTRNGSVYKLNVDAGHTSTNDDPINTNNAQLKWALQTYVMTGTGQVGTTTGIGTRDYYLYSDSIHPTAAGADALAQRLAGVVRDDLLAFASA